MSASHSWSARTTVRASPEDVIDTLTDPEACARWSPVPFTLDAVEPRLRPGATTPVSGRLFGAHIRFELDTLAADPSRLHLHARGPMDIFVRYTLEPVDTGCRVEAQIAIDPPNDRFGRLVARATGILLGRGTLHRTLRRIAVEAER
jgi:uncharacterized protein YndB with AHSA1/START domain